MTSRKTNIKQHYVPQFYLRNFADENEKFFVFDVNRENKYQTSPKKICYEKLLYDINPDILNKFSDHSENYEEIVDDNIRILNEEVSAILLNFLDRNIKSEKDFKFERPEREKLYCKLPLIRTVYSSNISTNLLFLILLGLAPRELSSAYFTGDILPSPTCGR